MQTVQVVALPNPVDDDVNSVASTEIPMAPPQPPMVMTGEDEEYMYGMVGMNEYSIEKGTGAVYNKNPETGEWLYVTNPMSNIPTTHQNEHMFQTLHAMNFILNQNIVRMNMEIQRLHAQEIHPLRVALDNALGTIKKLSITRKGSNPEMIQKIQNLETKNREFSENIQKFRKEKIQMEESNGKKIVEALAEQFKKFESEMKSKEEEIESYKIRIQSLNRSLDEKEKMNQSLSSELQSTNVKMKEMENEMKSFSVKENEWKSIRSELQTEIREMKKHIKEYEFSYVKQEDVQHLNATIDRLESDNSRMKSNFAKKMDEAIQEKTLPLQTEIQRLRTQVGNKDSEYKKLKSTYDKLNKSHQEMMEQQQLVEESKKREIQEIKNDLREITQKFDQLNDRYTTVDKAYANAREFCKKLSKEKNEMDAGYQNAMRDISKELEKMTFDNQRLTIENERIEKLFQECMSRFKITHAKNKELEEELKAFQMSVQPA